MTSTIKIKGMSCEHCVKAVTKALNGIQGISDVVVSLEAGEATFSYEGAVDQDLLREQIEDAGYELG